MSTCVTDQPSGPPPEAVRPTPPASYLAAKRIAEQRIYPDHRITLYCGYGFTEDKEILPDACGYEPRNDNVRARRMEWEHVVPASRLGGDRVCWQERERFPERVLDDGSRRSGRECCRRVDPEFRAMEAEIHNLVPSVGELNADRSNLPYGDVPGEPRAYGDCDFEVADGVVEPAIGLRGDLARIYLAMDLWYDIGPAREERAQFEAWSKADPPDLWEVERDARIGAVEGAGNPFVLEAMRPQIDE
jgi:deoxyribonuclease-1